MRSLVRGAMTLAAFAMAAPATAQAQAKPVIAVLYFDNNSIGKDRLDFDGVGKGIAEMLITDMSQNANIRVVERERVQQVLTEQSLTRAGSIDPQTAIKLGKIIGAQYMITGGFMSDGRGNYVLTARAINVETTLISNPVRLNSKGDDVLGLIAQLSDKLNNEMKLPALRVGDAGAPSSPMPAGHQVTQPAAQPVAETTPAPSPTVAKAADPVPADRAVPVTKSKPRKMDIRTAMLYSKALEEEDAGNRSKAVELFRQVVDRFPDYAPAQTKIAKLSRG